MKKYDYVNLQTLLKWSRNDSLTLMLPKDGFMNVYCVDFFLQNSEQQLAQTEILKEDLQLSQCEILSLKRLMYGKDYLVTQKTKALDLSKVGEQIKDIICEFLAVN